MKSSVIIPQELFNQLTKEDQQLLVLGYDANSMYVNVNTESGTELLIYQQDSTRCVHNMTTILRELISVTHTKKELDDLRELKKSLDTLKAALKE